MVLSFVLVQCTKENLNKTSGEKIELREQNNETSPASSSATDCLPDMTSCPFVERVIETIAVPGVCNSVDVAYDVYDCGGGNIVFDDFVAFPSIVVGVCDNYWHYLWSLSDIDLEYALDSLTYAASVIAENQYMTDYVIEENILCGYGQAAQATFYSMGCYKYCVSGLSEKEGIPWNNFQRVKCGTKCCIRMTSYCLNDDGEVIPQGPSFTETGGQDCGELPFFCVERVINPQGDCEKPCGAP